MITVDRRVAQLLTTYSVADANGKLIASLTFRDVLALIAAEQGRVRCRWRRKYAPWFYDAYLQAECDDHGIGFGTISGLQGNGWSPGLIELNGDDEGPLALTPLGHEVLRGIKELAGVITDAEA